ncbi:hypothetical protein EASAB2608_06539 [Streptomyces sp. EAS-AB2608]|nr:hypothetical protein EASAB2608_06539 [Streptomyces sp. EAS-AB2608]
MRDGGTEMAASVPAIAAGAAQLPDTTTLDGVLSSGRRGRSSFNRRRTGYQALCQYLTGRLRVHGMTAGALARLRQRPRHPGRPPALPPASAARPAPNSPPAGLSRSSTTPEGAAHSRGTRTHSVEAELLDELPTASGPGDAVFA